MVILQTPSRRLHEGNHETEDEERNSANENVESPLLLCQIVLAVVRRFEQSHFLHFVVEGDLKLELGHSTTHFHLLDLVEGLGPARDLGGKRLVFRGSHWPWRALSGQIV